MEQSAKPGSGSEWRRYLPPFNWLAHYQAAWLTSDFVAGVTLAAYAIPVALAYATLAGLPPQVGIYGYLLGGLGYALLGSSRQLAIGPTSAISLMIAGTVGEMAGGDTARYAEIASLAGFTVALLCLISWLFRLSVLVRLISDSILVGFKAGAGLTIIMTQLPSLFGVSGGGHNFFERAVLLLGELGQIQYLVLAIGLLAIVMLLAGERAFPGRPIALAVVILAIAAASVFGLPALGVPITGKIPQGLPSLTLPTLRLRDVDGIFPLLYRRCFGCTQLRDQIRLRARSAAGVSRARCGESRCGPWAWLSGCRWLVAIRGQRQSWRADSACAYLCIAHPCGVAIVSHWVFAKSSQSRSRRRCIHGRARSGRYPHTVADVADQQS